MEIYLFFGNPICSHYLNHDSLQSSILSGFASTFSNRLLGNYGTDAIAAMAAASKTTMLIGMIQMGICMGIQPLLAYNYGARDILRLKEVIQKVSILTVSVGMVTGGFCYLCRHRMIGMFIKEASVAYMGEELVFFLVAVGVFFMLQKYKNCMNK